MGLSLPICITWHSVQQSLLETTNCLHLFYGSRDFCNSSCALFYGWFFLILKACKQHKSSVTSVLFAASCFASDFRSGFAYIPVNMRGEAHRNTFANCVSQLFFPTSVQPPPQDKETFTPDLKAYIWNLASMIGNAILKELENGKKPGGKLLHHKSSLEESSVPLAAIPMRESLPESSIVMVEPNTLCILILQVSSVGDVGKTYGIDAAGTSQFRVVRIIAGAGNSWTVGPPFVWAITVAGALGYSITGYNPPDSKETICNMASKMEQVLKFCSS